MTTHLQLQGFVTADSITILNAFWLSFLSPAAALQYSVSPIVNEPFTRKDALVILHPGEKKQKTAGPKNMAHAQASAVASFVTH